MKTAKHTIKWLVPFKAKTPALHLLILLLAGIIYSGCKKKDYVAVTVPSISSVSDTLLKVGDTIKINGSNFSATPSENLVSIASVSLKVISATPTQLKAIIPVSAQTGQLTVAYASGEPARYPGKIHIVVTGQPIVNYITPKIIGPGDTIALHGSGFGTPFTTNGLTMGGLTVPIYNVSDSVAKAIVPLNAVNGSVIITTKGLSSVPYPYTITPANPLLDGRLYWVVASRTYGQNPPSGVALMQGADQAVAPYATKLATLDKNDFTQPDYYYNLPDVVFDNSMQRFNATNIVADANSNYYYLTNTPGTESYSLVKISVKPAFSRTVIWTHTFSAGDVGTTTFTDPVYGDMYGVSIDYVNYPMTRLSIDGNKLYIKLGLTNNFYVGDVSGGSFNPTLQTYNLPDKYPYAIEFGKNYIFYGSLITDDLLFTFDPNKVGAIHYIQRGGGAVSKTIPLDPSEWVVSYMTDPSHNDNLLIYTVKFAGSTFAGAIYKFNASTGILTKLFDKNNWADAISKPGDKYGYNLADCNLGFLWVNNHIYYANNVNILNSRPTIILNRLNDDGSSFKSTNIYPSIDLTTSGGITIGSMMPLFIDKTQAKP